MKILLLMPCDEQHVYAATGIYKAMSHEAKEVTFAIPTFMDYLIDSKLVGNWVYALFDALLSCRKLCEAADASGDDLIIIGNAPADIKFDIVFNFQEIEEALPYEDKFIEKVKTIVAEDEKLLSMLTNLHQADESYFALENCVATGDFISAYLLTDTTDKMAELKQKYFEKIKYLNVLSDYLGKENTNGDEHN